MALGVEVRKDPPSSEVGTYQVFSTEAARTDPLFRDLPESYTAQLGHKDRAMALPRGVTLLARSDRCPYQAFRVGEGLVYATQFHPELTHDENRLRFNRYFAEYSEAFGAERAKTMLDEFQPSPHASDLLRKFRALVEG